MQLRQLNLLPSYLLGLIVVGCGGSDALDEGVPPWDADQITVVPPAGADAVITTSPEDGACLEVSDLDCVDADLLIDECGPGEAADAVVDESGKIVDVVCLPPDAVTITPAQLDDGEIPQDANHTAVDFSGTTTVYEDDLVVDANGVVLYGDDPDEAVIEGDLEVTGNNTVVRGLTIDGDVSISLNNATFVYCRITGNVDISFNNAEIIGCEIFGDVTISGNNTLFSGNLLGGAVEISGRDTRCDADNYTFVDEDEDFRVSEEEVGDVLDLDCRPADPTDEEETEGEGMGGPPMEL